jgi:tetratricopeptide (TPR) repeat protein
MPSKKGMHATPKQDWTFGQMLDWHLARGTRADGSPKAKGVPWQNKNFANSVGTKSSEGSKTERTVRNWRNSETLPSPADFHAILLLLFGSNQDYAEWKAELTDKYHAPREQEADAPLDDTPSNVSMPTKPPRCMGREEDLKSVVGALTATSTAIAVLILGGPGMGKTTLTREAANDPTVIARFGNRRWLVELETAVDAQIFETAIAKALGLDPAAAKFDDALALLERAPGLLVLDNLETPWDGARDQIEKLISRLHAVPTLALLASIRGNEPPAGLRWTRQRTMHPLESPFDRDLFLDIAQDIKADDPHLEPLLGELGGVPLVVELVALQAAAHDALSSSLDEWHRIGSTFARRRGIEPSRLTALDISLELSFNSQRLGESGRRLFSVLGQLPAGIGAEDLKTLFKDSTFEARHGLLACGLGFERNGRLDLLPPVRDHSRRFHAPLEADAVLWRNHFLALAQDHGDRLGTAEGVGSMERLSVELANLEAAQIAALSGENLAGALSALHATSLTMQFTGLGSSAAIQQVMSACHLTGDILGEANCIKSVGDIALARSDHDAARKAYEQALTLYRQVGHILGEANCIQNLGNIALARSDHDTARKAHEQALPLYRQIGDILGEANCIRSLGNIAHERSDHDAARKSYEQALPLYRQVGKILGEANCIKGLGNIALARSDNDAARKAYEQALPLYRQFGDILGEANCIRSLGDIALVRSDHDAARKAYEQALPLYRQVGDILGEANCIRSLGDIALERSDHDASRKAYQRALPLYRQVGDILGEANCIKSLGDIALARSDHDAARKAYEQALPLYRQFGDILGEANCILSLGGVALASSEHDAARKAYEQALLLYRQVGAILGEANCIKGLGDIALAHSEHEAAHGKFLEALRLYQRISEPYSIGHAYRRLAGVTEGEERKRHLAAARAAWTSIDRSDLTALLD